MSCFIPPACGHWHCSCHPVPMEMGGGEWRGSDNSPCALGGRRGTQELLASHLSGQCPVLEQRGMVDPGGREEGQELLLAF